MPTHLPEQWEVLALREGLDALLNPLRPWWGVIEDDGSWTVHRAGAPCVPPRALAIEGWHLVAAPVALSYEDAWTQARHAGDVALELPASRRCPLCADALA